MKGFKITNIENNEIEFSIELYYSDIEYFNVDTKDISGDMGFAFCDQRETRNRNSLKDNINGTKEWAESIIYNEGVMNEGIEILYVCKGSFFDCVYADEYDNRYLNTNKKVSKTNAMRITRKYLKEDFMASTATADDYGKPIYALALCSPKVGKKLNLEKYIGMKVHYYNPIQISENFASVEKELLICR